MPHPLLVLLSCLALLPVCCNTDSADAGAAPAATAPGASLQMRDGELHLLGVDGDQVLEVDGARSFVVNESAGCLVLSSLDGQLEPVSWVIGPDRDADAALSLPGMLPLALEPGYLAFSSLPDSLYEPGAELSVVNPDGQEVLRDGQAFLLQPQTGGLPADEFCTFEWESVDELSSMYIGPSISVRSAADGSALDSWKLPLEYPPADVELLHADNQSLLALVLMDIYYWHLVVLDRDADTAQVSYTLEGQPMYDQLLPSRSDRLSRLVETNGSLEWDVISLSDGALRLVVDTSSGQLLSSDPVANMPRNQNEDLESANDLIPALHISQHVLPLQIDSDWSMSAYFDQSGSLLLLTSNGPIWHEIQ
ncbi:hypothetical protein KDL29_07365 [bacterium]|nr:hypothetical protein [bacterium]